MEIIAEFSAKPADLQCLVIMGHGDLDGNISDINSESISVQDIIDAFSAKAVDVPKVSTQTMVVIMQRWEGGGGGVEV